MVIKWFKININEQLLGNELNFNFNLHLQSLKSCPTETSSNGPLSMFDKSSSIN